MNFDKSRDILLILFIVFSLNLLLFSCHRASTNNTVSAEKEAIDSIVRKNVGKDSLLILLKHYTETGNAVGLVIINRELGKRFREESLFHEAIEYHQQGLMYAEQIRDTLEIIQALNNLGTNFRRIGILDEASAFHYKALNLSEENNDESYNAKKNRVVSLNGIGNIYLTLKNYDVADSVFRAALAGEKELKSDLGLAINYANLGSIFESREMIDSALLYYNHSMEYNRAAKSNLGISLCYNHFGRIYERQGNWNKALEEYSNAYNLMAGSRDHWHWLESCLSLARVNILKNDVPVAQTYLKDAEKVAETIRSLEHKSEIYRLNYLCDEKQGNFRQALSNYTLSQTYADSVRNIDNMNRMQNLRINYEKEKGLREMTLMRENYEMQQRAKNLLLIGSLIALVLISVIVFFLWYALRMKSRSQQMMRQMEKVRNNFFTNITHEFRTPLTVIMGMSEQLRSTHTKDEELKTGLATIVRQSEHLLQLINQLLEISKVKSEVEEPEWRTGDVVTYLRMITESYQSFARQKYIDIRFITTQIAVVVDFVPGYLHKIVSNLLSNAIKFTPDGGLITIKIESINDTFVVNVSDTGKGIAEEDILHIFDPFYRGKNSGSNIGTGVGLSLVKQMTEGIGGTVYVKSTIGSGSEFTVIFPAKHGNTIWERWFPDEKEENTVILSDAANGQEDTALPTVLIVEDNPDVSYYIGELLKKNYNLLYARDGREGLEKAKMYMPDLIISDLMMLGMDGYEMCREVRQLDILNHIPIIIVTAKCGDDDRVQALQAGADAYLQKPFNTDELNARITKLLEQRRLLREKYLHAMREGNTQTVELNSVNKKFLNSLNNLIYSSIENQNLNSEMLADKMAMSLSQLNRKIKTITGFNSSGYILQMRLDKAKRLLSSTEDPIGEIASKCGFPDMSYFSRIFKQSFGVTPSQYRKALPPKHP